MTKSYQEKIDFLNRARHAEDLICALECVQRQDQKLLEELGNSEECEGIRNHLENLCQQRKQMLKSLVQIREEIAERISEIPDMQLRSVLERKYLAYQSLDQIAREMFFDKRTIQRKQKKALDLLKISDLESDKYQK